MTESAQMLENISCYSDSDKLHFVKIVSNEFEILHYDFIVTPKFSDALTLYQPRGTASAHHHGGRIKNLLVDKYSVFEYQTVGKNSLSTVDENSIIFACW